MYEYASIIWATIEPRAALMSLLSKTGLRDRSSPSSSGSCTARWGTAGRGRRRPVSRSLCNDNRRFLRSLEPEESYRNNLWLTRRYSSAQPFSNIHRFRPLAIQSSPSFWLRISTWNVCKVEKRVRLDLQIAPPEKLKYPFTSHSRNVG